MSARELLSRAGLSRLAWVVIPLSILLGDLVIRWNGSIPESVYTEPANLFVSVVLSMFLWWSLSRLVGMSRRPWLWAAVISVPVSALLVAAWRFRQFTFHDSSVGILLYAFREPQNAAQFVPHGFSLLVPPGIALLAVLWTVALTRWRGELTVMMRRLCIAMPVLWLLAGLFLPPGTPAYGSPYVSDLHVTQLFGEAVTRIARGEAGAVLNIPSERLRVPEVEVAERPNVILFVAESLRRDRLGIFGHDRDTTPHMARFIEQHSEEVFTFSRAYTPSPYSPLAMSSLLTGLAPARSKEELHTMPVLWNYTQAYKGTSFLTTPQDWSVHDLGEFFLVMDPPDKVVTAASFQAPTINDTGIDDRIVARRTVEMLHTELPADKPFMGMIVANASHFPFLMADDVPWPVNDIADRYDGAVRLVDEFVNDILQAVADTGRLEDTLFIFTADHSEFFYDLSPGEHEDDQRVRELWRDGMRVQSCHPLVANVPFWIYVPRKWSARLGLSSDVIRANQASSISNLDIVPTVLEVLGLQDVPVTAGYPSLDGQSLFQPMPADRVATCFTAASWVKWMPTGFAIYNREHAVYGREDFPRLEAYDLTDEMVFTESHRGEPLSEEVKAWLVHVRETEPNVGAYLERLERYGLWPLEP